MNPIYATTLDLAHAIRSGEISAIDALEAHLARIEQVNPTLNAVVILDAESARQRALEADAALARGEVWGALHGVPFTLKDCHETAGMRTTAGFEPLANYIPTRDSTVTARLKAAGGILMGKTNVSVLLGDIQSNNPIFGRTNNPWHLDRTAGGSSGGAGAALAAGMTPFEIGSDIGGSIRIPSHFNGVFGLKPTENRVSQAGHVPDLPDEPRSVRIMACLGPMARSVDDLALLYSIIAGPDNRDTEVQPVPVDPIPHIDLKDIRVAVAPTFGDFPVADSVRQAVLSAADLLKPHCATVEIAPLPALDYERSRMSEPDNLAVGVFAPDAEPVTLAQYMTALHRRDEYIIAWEDFFSAWDVLLCPVAMVPAFPHCETRTPLIVDGQETYYWMANAHSKIFNYTGHPALALPYTQDQDGLPIGLQVVTKRWGESRLLAIGQAMAAITGDFQNPPGYQVN